jgi:Na+/H+ antiporter
VTHEVEIFLELFAVLAALAAVAKRLQIPYPILLVLGGLVLGFIPGLPVIQLPPELLFVLFLPPLIYAPSLSLSLPDLRRNVRLISLLAVGLVLVTMLGVAAVAHTIIPLLTWPTAFVLGAIVSPTDASAAAAIGERLHLPRRLIVQLEGEGLTNDTTALVAYRMAIAAIVTGTFSLAQAGREFVQLGAGGALIGGAVGWLALRLRRWANDVPVELTLSLGTPFAAYVLAEALGLSGVIAVFAAGVCVGWLSPTHIRPATRQRALDTWDLLVFLLNGLLFLFLGLQSRTILARISGHTVPALIGFAGAVCGTVIVLRIVWVFLASYLPRALSRRIRRRDPYPPWQYPAILGWCGLRGADTLAAAMAVPLTLQSGAPFPHRDLLIYLAFSVILVTLVGQGLTLPLLIRRLGTVGDDTAEREEAKARAVLAQAAVARLDELKGKQGVPEWLRDQLRAWYGHEADGFQALEQADNGPTREALGAQRRLLQEAIGAKRRALLALRRSGAISDDVLSRIQRDLDLEAVRFGAQAA